MLQRLFMDAKKHFLSRIVVAGLMTMLPLFMRGHESVQPAKAALPPMAVPVDPAVTVTTPPRVPAAVNVVQRLEPTMPLDSMRITSRFGTRMHPILHRVMNHDGVDLAADLNDPIHAVYDGVVTSAGWRGGYGNAVEIYHAKLGKKTLYGHMNAIQVRAGQRIAEGQVIGLAGTTGVSTGVHLHFGVEDRNGDWNEPIAFLNGLSGQPASTMIATAPAPARSYAPERRVAAAAARPHANKRRTTAPPVQVASNSTAPKLASKASSAPAAPTKPDRDISALQQRFAAAAQAAATYSSLYDEGAVSRLDRDTRIAAAKQLQAELQAAQ